MVQPVAKKRPNPLVSLISLIVLAYVAYTYVIPAIAPGARGPGGGTGGGGIVSATLGQPIVVNGIEVTNLTYQFAASLQYQQPPAGTVFVAYKFQIRNTSRDQKFVGLNNFTIAADGSQQGQFGFAVNDAWQPALSIEQLAPGNTLTGWIVFTVPKPANYVLLTYRDNLFSGSPDVQWRMACC